MGKNEFLKLYGDLSLKERHTPIFLYRGKGIAWSDIYFEAWQKRGNRLLKFAEKKGLLKMLIENK